MRGIIAFSAAAGFLQPFVIQLLTGDDDKEEYFKLPEHTRRNNLILPIGKGNFIKIPLSHELRVFFGIGETAYSVFSKREDVAEGMIDVLSAISDIVPLDPMSAATASPWNVITPDIAKPVLQSAINKTWTGAPVYNEWANETLPGYRNIKTNKRGEPYAPEWLIGAAKALDGATGGDGTQPGLASLNPDKANHILGGYLGGLYTLLSQTADAAYKAASDDKTVRAKDIPFANRFYTANEDLNALTTDTQEKFYKARKEINEAATQYKDYEKRLHAGENIAGFDSKAEELHKKMQFKKSLNAIEKQYSALKSITGEEQREAEEEIAETIKSWLKEYTDEVYGEQDNPTR
jgi:hypothetical protein